MRFSKEEVKKENRKFKKEKLINRIERKKISFSRLVLRCRALQRLAPAIQTNAPLSNFGDWVLTRSICYQITNFLYKYILSRTETMGAQALSSVSPCF